MTVWVLCPGSHPHPCPLPSRERGPEAAWDGFPVSSTGQAPFAWERRLWVLCPGSHPHPCPLPSRERGTAFRRGWVPVCTGTTVWALCAGSHPHPVSGYGAGSQSSPVKGEGAGGSRGWVPRIEYGAGSVCTGMTVWALCPGSHPHPIPLPSRERGLDVTLTPYRGTGQALNPLPSRERRPEAGDGFPLKAGTTMWRTGTAVGWGRLVRRPGCPGLAG